MNLRKKNLHSREEQKGKIVLERFFKQGIILNVFTAQMEKYSTFWLSNI